MLEVLKKLLFSVQLSHLIVFFKDAQFIPVMRSELFGLTDFLANCGGLLGLFMGVSILSLVEIFYYCVIKPLIMWSKSHKNKGNSVQFLMVEGQKSVIKDHINIWQPDDRVTAKY